MAKGHSRHDQTTPWIQWLQCNQSVYRHVQSSYLHMSSSAQKDSLIWYETEWSDITASQKYWGPQTVAKAWEPLNRIYPQVITQKPTVRQKGQIRKWKPTFTYSSIIYKTIGMNGVLSWNSAITTEFIPWQNNHLSLSTMVITPTLE